MERGAFGVAEPAHFAYYGLPIFLICLFLLRWNAAGKTAGIVFGILLVIGIALPLQYYHLRLFAPFVAKHWLERNGGGEGEVGIAGREQPLQQTLFKIVERVGKEKPYLMFQLDYYSFPVYRKLRLRYPTYFTMITSSARTHDDIRRIISQLRASQAVILARRGDLLPKASVSEKATGLTVIDWLSGAHTPDSRLYALMQKSEDRLYQPLKDFILASYDVQFELDGIVALVPKHDENRSHGLVS